MIPKYCHICNILPPKYCSVMFGLPPQSTVQSCPIYPLQSLLNPSEFASDPPTSAHRVRPSERALKISAGLGSGLTLSANLRPSGLRLAGQPSLLLSTCGMCTYSAVRKNHSSTSVPRTISTEDCRSTMEGSQYQPKHMHL